jgi:zinc/manganese transport system substrate-binding protein
MLGVLFSLGIVAALITGCASAANSSNSAAGDKLEVVATTTQIGDFVRRVGGDSVDAYQILQPNTDPHEYEPRPDDVRAIAEAGLVFTNGDKLDYWIGKVVSEGGGDPKVVNLGEGVPVKLSGESGGKEASKYDPHWWHDPRNAVAAVEEIRDALVRADPRHKAEYQKNARIYLDKIAKLDRNIEGCIQKIPGDQRKLVTDHDAFGYFARRYRIKIVGAVIPSQSTQAQPSAGEVSDLTSLIERENVKAIFPETSINPKLAQQIARQTGVSADYTLYGDTLGPEGSSGDTYLKMEAANANAIVKGLTGGHQSCRIPVV